MILTPTDLLLLEPLVFWFSLTGYFWLLIKSITDSLCFRNESELFIELNFVFNFYEWFNSLLIYGCFKRFIIDD
jgi:hypothetical protein